MLFHLPNRLCDVCHFKVRDACQVENKCGSGCCEEDDSCHGAAGRCSAARVRALGMYSMWLTGWVWGPGWFCTLVSIFCAAFLFFGEKTTTLGLWEVIPDKCGHRVLSRAKYKGNRIFREIPVFTVFIGWHVASCSN